MGFSKMMELLQIKNKGKIVFCNAGNFYIAIGKDAILLNELLDLKVSCLKPEVCKVGFPLQALEKYTNLIEEKKYSYIVYFFKQEDEELEKIKEYNGKNKSEILEEKLNCYNCKHSTKYYKKTDKYIKALTKLYEQEEKDKDKNVNNAKREDNRKVCFINKKKKTS